MKRLTDLVMNFEQVQKLIDCDEKNRITTLQELIAIPSVAEEGKEPAPFGEEVDKAFKYFLSKGESMGFLPKNVDNYGGHIAWPAEILPKDGEGSVVPEILGIVCHLDVVPAGNNWSFPAFGGEIAAADTEDSSEYRLYGRGAIDDKGPAVAVLYAMKALKDSGFKPKREVRLILGLDEETNWKGMEYYSSKEDPPTLGFTPDAEFPAIHGEKGILVFELAKKLSKAPKKGLILSKVTGGFAANMVADSARAVVKAEDPEVYETIYSKAALLNEEGVMDINTKRKGKSLEIVVKGISAHGARPETGINAISRLMRFLGGLAFNSDDVNEFIEFYNKAIGEETDGAALGCLLEDVESGKTVVNVGLVEIDSKAARVTVNLRYPVTATDEQVYKGMDEVCNKYGLGIIKGKHQKPIFIPEDDDFVKTLMDIYREHTGDEESKPIVIGGGTYARAFDNVIAFGSSFPSRKECAHQKNEYISLSDFRIITHIYADAIYRLAGSQNEMSELLL